MKPSDFFPAPRVRSRSQTQAQIKNALLGIANWARKKGLLAESKKEEQEA